MNRPIHFEILGEDPGRLAAFYEAVFGWRTSTWEGPQEYWPVTTGPSGSPGIDGGIMGRHFDQRVINTVHVASVDATVSRVEASGGRLVHGPHQVPGVGLHAYCADPEGVMFGVLEPGTAESEAAA
jgi:uncharacterized protein